MITINDLYEHLTTLVPGHFAWGSVLLTPEGTADMFKILNQNVDLLHGLYSAEDVQWEGDFFATLFNYLEIFQVSLIGIFILILALFFPRSGRFTRFLNKLSFEYVVLVLVLNSFDVVVRAYHIDFTAKLALSFLDRVGPGQSIFNLYSFENWNDKFSAFASVLQGDLLLTKVFIWFSLVALAITFYGLADRFFIANSYDIEFTLLVFLIYIGSVILFLANNLIEFALALEVITLGSYGLAAYERKSKFSSYAGVQYFIIGSIPSGMLVLSLALMYKAWGTLAIADIDVLLNQIFKKTAEVGIPHSFFFDFDNPRVHIVKGAMEYEEFLKSGHWGIHFSAARLFCDAAQIIYMPNTADTVLKISIPNEKAWAERLVEWKSIYGSTDFTNTLLSSSFIEEKKIEMLFALFLVLFNLLFKITAAPFNFWAPSVYGNAPVSSVTFLSIFSKVAVIFALVKLLTTMLSQFQHVLLTLLIFVGVFSIIFGMAGAFAEKTIKRFYVYSSMGHVGFMVVAMALSTTNGYGAVFHYLFVYILSSYLMWFVLIIMGRSRNNLTHFGSLKNIDKWVATAFALLVFSMSGIPPLGGFFVKLDVLIALIDSSQYYINFLLLFFSVISFFYYLRLIKIIYFDERKEYIRDIHISEERLWMVAVLFLVLLFYMFIIHKPLLTIEREALAGLVNS